MRRDYPIEESLIDESILSQGTVAVYVRLFSTGETVYPLPLVLHITKGNIAQMLNFEVNPGEITLNFFDLVDDSVDPGTFGVSVEHRYVIIPGGTATMGSVLDLTDYAAVVDQYGIDP